MERTGKRSRAEEDIEYIELDLDSLKKGKDRCRAVLYKLQCDAEKPPKKRKEEDQNSNDERTTFYKLWCDAKKFQEKEEDPYATKIKKLEDEIQSLKEWYTAISKGLLTLNSKINVEN